MDEFVDGDYCEDENEDDIIHDGHKLESVCPCCGTPIDQLEESDDHDNND